MAKADLLTELLKAYKDENNAKFEEVVNKIIEDKEKKKHTNLASQLRNIMENYERKKDFPYHHSFEYFEKLPRDSERQNFLIDIKKSRYMLKDIILSPNNKELIEDIIDDYYKLYLLKSYNLKPKAKILFCGPPGCGKTVTAEAISTELQLPLVYCKLDSIVSSYLGDTASNLRKVFDYITSIKSVVFFDEFDAIGKSRDDDHEHGEIKRVVNSFLQMIDTYEGESVIIAATNHQGLLDRAVWRRFDEIIFFDKPSIDEIYTLLKIKLRTFPKKDLDYDQLSMKMQGMSHSEIELICKDAMRISVKNGKTFLDMDTFIISLNKQLRRKEIYKEYREPSKN